MNGLNGIGYSAVTNKFIEKLSTIKLIGTGMKCSDICIFYVTPACLSNNFCYPRILHVLFFFVLSSLILLILAIQENNTKIEIIILYCFWAIFYWLLFVCFFLDEFFSFISFLHLFVALKHGVIQSQFQFFMYIWIP